MVGNTICGVLSIRTTTCSMCWFSHTERVGGQTVLPEAAQRIGVSAAGDRHRQARQLPGSVPRDAGIGRASTVEVFEQSSREFPPTDPTTRTCDETLHLIRNAQRSLLAFSRISPHCRPRRHLLTAAEWRTEMADRFAVGRSPQPMPPHESERPGGVPWQSVPN